MAFAAGFGRLPALAGAVGTVGADPEVAAPPADAVSSLGFSPSADLLAATSWDSKLGCWEVSAAGQTAPKVSFSADQPLLCSSWSADGRSIFAGECLTDLSVNTRQYSLSRTWFWSSGTWHVNSSTPQPASRPIVGWQHLSPDASARSLNSAADHTCHACADQHTS